MINIFSLLKVNVQFSLKLSRCCCKDEYTNTFNVITSIFSFYLVVVYLFLYTAVKIKSSKEKQRRRVAVMLL